jgi:hypothetical protein
MREAGTLNLIPTPLQRAPSLDGTGHSLASVRNVRQRRKLILSHVKDHEMPSISFGERAAAKFAAIVTLLALIPNELAAQGQPVETASHLPVALWFIGAGVLGLVLAYGIMRNRRRTRAEKAATEEATKDLYARENRN